jgi:hypothetical protein
MNCQYGSGWIRMGEEVNWCLKSKNALSAAGDYVNRKLWEVSADRGKARVL